MWTVTPPRSTIVLLVVGAVALLAVVLGFGLEVLGLAVLIPLGIAIVRRPQWGVLVLAALVPFNGLLQITSLPSAIVPWKRC